MAETKAKILYEGIWELLSPTKVSAREPEEKKKSKFEYHAVFS